MQALFIHQTFPAQLGHIATTLARASGWRCAYVSQNESVLKDGLELIQYAPGGGATRHSHFCSRTFENNMWHSDAVYSVLAGRPDIKPDLIIGHSGLGSTLFLRELYPHVPVINLFEYYYQPHTRDNDMDFRRDLNWQMSPMQYMRSRCRNAMLLLDLQNCQAGYCPTEFQRSRFPAEYQYKLRTIFDGIDRSIYHSHGDALRPPIGERKKRVIAGIEVGPETRVVTYVSRGFESMRGFDLFMQAARLIAQERPDVVFIVVGSERMNYGGDEAYIGEHATFKEWVLAQHDYDLSRFHFVGRLPPADLGRVLASTDLHIYLTVPFVLSWSMMNAMSCGAVVLGSDTAPVREMIRDGHNGLLTDFFSPDEMAAKALQVLADPDAYRPLGEAAERLIADRYSIERIMPQMLEMYRQVIQRGVAGAPTVASRMAESLIGELPADGAVTGRVTNGFAAALSGSSLVPLPRPAALLSGETVVTTALPRAASPFRG